MIYQTLLKLLSLVYWQIIQTPCIGNQKSEQEQSGLTSLWTRWLDVSRKIALKTMKTQLLRLRGCTFGDSLLGSRAFKTSHRIIYLGVTVDKQLNFVKKVSYNKGKLNKPICSEKSETVCSIKCSSQIPLTLIHLFLRAFYL